MKIKRNLPVAKSEQRTRWPFADMRVNDVVDIADRKNWRKISKYAHTFAGYKKTWKFHCKWLADKNVGRIRRIK
jgi:hypothetical protein